MTGWRSVVIAGALLCPVSAASQEVSLRDFSGQWRGVELLVSGGSSLPELSPDFLDVEIRPSGEGFSMRWNGLERADGAFARRELEASFVPTGRPGVFAFETEQGSLFGLFASPTTGNPLEGEVLLWARIDGATLVSYGLRIHPSGGYDLYRTARTLTDDGATVQSILRTDDPDVLTIEGRLERAGG